MIYLPMKLSPCYKEYLWGGNHLKKQYGKLDAPDVTAESWELACHPDGVSRISGGVYNGMTIQDLGELDREKFWGKNCRDKNFPILVKLIDAGQDLSVQVHPSDQTALLEKGEQGKAEMWYVVDCRPHSYIYYGFSRQMLRSEFLHRASDGSICEVLNRVPVAPGDVFYILPGTVHAIGAGIVIAEIQQSSNTTFRVFDYQRRGADGKLRPLHLERAADVANYMPVVPQECRTNSGVKFSGFSMKEMFSCPYFQGYNIEVRQSVALCCDGRSFHHLLCVEGRGVIRAGGIGYGFHCGDSYFMPAALGDYEIEGNCRILLSRV